MQGYPTLGHMRRAQHVDAFVNGHPLGTADLPNSGVMHCDGIRAIEVECDFTFDSRCLNLERPLGRKAGNSSSLIRVFTRSCLCADARPDHGSPGHHECPYFVRRSIRASRHQGDVNLPSAEGILRQIHNGNEYFRHDFGKASNEYLHHPVAVATAAYVLESLLKLPPGITFLGLHPVPFFIILLGVVTGIYTLFGGLLAVVWTESFQTVLLLTGAIAITVAGWRLLGGWHPLVQSLQTSPHPLAGTSVHFGSFDPDTRRFLKMMRPAGDPSGLPWYSILLGYQVLAVWYWCTDQTIVQRVLAAKDVRNAQLGAIFCAWLKILPVFFFVLPGVICVALVQQGAFGGASPGDPVNTYTFMVTHLLPAGLRGLVAAALVAAAMQTCSAALNSIAALVAYDLVRTRRPAISDRDLVRVGRATTAVGTLIAIGVSPIFGHYTSIIEGLNKLMSYAAPPMTAVVLGGSFTRWATARAAAATLILGMCAGSTIFLLDWFHVFRPDYMLTTFLSCVVCFLVLYLISRQKPESLSPVAERCIWSSADLDRRSLPVLLPAATVLCIFAALYVYFW